MRFETEVPRDSSLLWEPYKSFLCMYIIVASGCLKVVCACLLQEVKDGHAQMKTLTHLWYRELRAESAEDDDTDHELEAR